jgi:hypothetical protein
MYCVPRHLQRYVQVVCRYIPCVNSLVDMSRSQHAETRPNGRSNSIIFERDHVSARLNCRLSRVSVSPNDLFDLLSSPRVGLHASRVEYERSLHQVSAGDQPDQASPC